MSKLLIVSLSLSLITVLVRSYKLPQTFMFAEDQEDLSLRVKQIIIDRQPTLLSAKFSSVGLYLPPGYLYFLIPFFLITGFHPSAAMIAVVILSGLTALFMFLAGYYLGGIKVGVIAWTIYTFWPLLHTWDHIFWNPNLILPATSLLLLALLKRRPVLAAISSGIALQSHPQAIMLVLFTLFYFRRHWPVVVSTIFLFVSPLILFEIRHSFVIWHALLNGSNFTFRPYYLMFLYPCLILALAWVFTRHRLFLIFPLLFLIISLPKILYQPDRPDSLRNKLAATSAALDLIQSGQASPNIQVTGPADGFHYLIWYLSRQKGITTPIAFHESWDNPPPHTAVIKP